MYVLYFIGGIKFIIATKPRQARRIVPAVQALPAATGRRRCPRTGDRSTGCRSACENRRLH